MDSEQLTDASDNELWTMLGDATALPRAELLCELGQRAALRGEYGRAASLFGSAGTTSAEHGDATLAGFAFSQQGMALFDADEFGEAAVAHTQSVTQYHLAGRAEEAAHVLWAQAAAFLEGGDMDGCLTTTIAARSLAESEDLPELAGRACLLQARALNALDRELEALDACEAGRQFSRSAGEPTLVAQIDDFRLTLCLALGRLDQALELATGCFVLAKASGLPEDAARAELRLAETHLTRGEADLALVHAEQARARHTDVAEMLGAARCDRVRGDALFELDRADEAIAVFTQARVLFDANGHDLDSLRCDADRAVVLHMVGRFADAATLNARLVAAYHNMTHNGVSVDLSWSVARLADNYLALDDPRATFDVTHEWVDRLDAHDADAKAPLINTLAAHARATEALSGLAPAAQIAERVLSLTSQSQVNRNTAWMYDIRARHLLESNDPRAEHALAQAIAMHLAMGCTDRARELSKHFLPAPGELHTSVAD
ncbi:MAG: hypothetical protein WCP28_14210 [Actinomycetes bacterium]